MDEQADWSSLQLFLVLAEAGSLGRAVHQLGQSQPTLSRQLVLLEVRLGQVLFERHARGLRLTAAGEHLLPAARRMREAAREFAMTLAAREQTLALVRVLPEITIPPLPLWLTAHRELRDTPRLRLVFDHLAGAFAAPTMPG